MSDQFKALSEADLEAIKALIDEKLAQSACVVSAAAFDTYVDDFSKRRRPKARPEQCPVKPAPPKYQLGPDKIIITKEDAAGVKSSTTLIVATNKEGLSLSVQDHDARPQNVDLPVTVAQHLIAILEAAFATWRRIERG